MNKTDVISVSKVATIVAMNENNTNLYLEKYTSASHPSSRRVYRNFLFKCAVCNLTNRQFAA